MRLRKFLAIAGAALGLTVVAAAPASAFGWWPHSYVHAPAGWGEVRPVRHWVYYPRYQHIYHVDPYAYRYSPRGYYPWYGSNYWAPADVIRKRSHLRYHHWNAAPPRYRYHPAWSHPGRWHHEAWHRRNHGYHHRWHW